MKNYLDCQYSAFISYATDDDVLLYDWISTFAGELNLRVPARLNGANWRKVHLSGSTPVVAGALDAQLKQRIANSFAMVVVVYKKYKLSSHCLKELQYFASVFGEAALKERLYIVALSEESIEERLASADWKAIFRDFDPTWTCFYDAIDKGKALPISGDDGKTRPKAFTEIFTLLCDDLSEKINATTQKAPAAPAFVAAQPLPDVPVVTAQGPGSRNGALIYIESNIRERDEWEAIGDRIRATWNSLVGSESGATPLALSARGLPVDDLDKWPSLSDADGVVLLWGRKPPNALIAQIDKVEGKLSGRYPAPGIVAYLIPPQNRTGNKLPAWGWKVLRFNADAINKIDVDPEEADDLKSFLKKILDHSRARVFTGEQPLHGTGTSC
ncbi:hypothetical protein [Paraburkholderia sp. J7]|uniref:hypothetical protein n=1 Tax=Paraburkholderia sp. J7 TaxID=2805438 RepID=UPI002AB7D693|nr:hypothetical protein [Paraburkholderia sp. J7]